MTRERLWVVRDARSFLPSLMLYGYIFWRILCPSLLFGSLFLLALASSSLLTPRCPLPCPSLGTPFHRAATTMIPSLLFFTTFLLTISTFTISVTGQGVVPGFPNPLVDPFYAQPSDLSSLSPGQVIATRLTNSTFVTSSDNLDYSYQIKFRSQDSLSRPIAAITTVLVPRKKSRTATGQASMLSFQNFEDAVSLSCSPSWAYVAGSGSNAAGAANLEAPIVNGWALDQGHYVAIPDHQG